MNSSGDMIINSQGHFSGDAILTFKTDGSILLQSNNRFEFNNSTNTIILKVDHIIFQVIGLDFILNHIEIIVVSYLLMFSFEK